MYGIILGTVWQSTGFYMALMLAGLRSINTEIWQAARLDGVPFWRLYLEVIIPMMKLTFLTSILLLSIGVVKAYDIIVAMTNGGPGGVLLRPCLFRHPGLLGEAESRLRLGRRGNHAASSRPSFPALRRLPAESDRMSGHDPHIAAAPVLHPRAGGRSSRIASRSSSFC